MATEWQTGGVPLLVGCEIETVTGRIVRGWFISKECFRATNGDLFFEWERFRLVTNEDEDDENLD